MFTYWFSFLKLKADSTEWYDTFALGEEFRVKGMLNFKEAFLDISVPVST